MATFAAHIRQTSPNAFATMAKIRVMSNQRRVGAVGDTTYYVRDGEQIARQSKNNSNYGAGASRSEAQQRRRVKWANLVNFYKACQFWMPKAFESVKPGQTMYNKFMQLNINESVVSLTKDMAQSGCCCVEPFQVAKGTFPRIEITNGTDNYNKKAAIVLTQSVTSSTTVAEFSADILDNNPDWLEGDNMAIILFESFKDASRYPYVRTIYKELTLSKTSTDLVFSKFPAGWIGKTSGNLLGIFNENFTGDSASFALIKTRKVSGSLKVSSAFIENVDPTQWNDWTGAEWLQECIDSYGVDTEVPLDPNFNPGTIQRVTANGVAVTNAQSLSGSQELRVYVGDSDGSSVRLFFNGVLYTPLLRGDGYLGYILGDNGICQIYTDESLYISFSVSGIVVPSGLPASFTMMQKTSTAIDSSPGTYSHLKSASTKCMNYPYLFSEDYPYYLIWVQRELDLSEGSFTYHNCQEENLMYSGNLTRLNVSVVNPDEVAYIEYKDFIIAVFNYTN